MDNPPSSSVPSPSTAARPDLDWSQIRETIQMLNLAVAQIEMALKDSSGSVEILTDSFTVMHEAHGPRRVGTPPAGLTDQGNHRGCRQWRVAADATGHRRLPVLRPSDATPVACLPAALEELSGVVNDPQRLYNPFAWNALQQKIRSKYTMEDEKLMFDTLIATGSVEQALKLYVDRGTSGIARQRRR